MFKEKDILFKLLFLLFNISFLFIIKISNLDKKKLKIFNKSQNNNDIFLKINKTQNSLKSFYKYFNICNKLIRLDNKKKSINKYPFVSICIPVYNTEKYIERAVLSIINQSFQDFEIIIVNDCSNDNTLNIIKRLQKEDNRIRIINHYNNSGVYNSRVEAALNANGKYMIFLDPDDIILNQYLFEYLYNYNSHYNLDIIEFLVYEKKEKRNNIYYPKNTMLNHKHNFANNIIYQPELSDILFAPNTKTYFNLICRNIWNKAFRKKLILKSIEYIGEEYYFNKNLIVADDTFLNIIAFHFAKNYTIINIGGYLYNVRPSSMSKGFININHRIRQNISFFLYFKLLYKYIKDFDKDRNFLFNEINIFKNRIIEFKKLHINDYLEKVKLFLYEIKNDDKSSELLKNLMNKLLLELN